MKLKKLSICLFIAATSTQAQVKIGDNPTNVGPSSSLELESTNKALVVPRLTNTAAITTPVNGMIIYCVTDNRFKVYQNNSWVNMFT